MSESALQLAYDRIEELELKLESANERIARMESFINRFLDPEDLGYVVNNYVRDDAREALGRERVESKR
jgi:hypothetical protein